VSDVKVFGVVDSGGGRHEVRIALVNKGDRIMWRVEGFERCDEYLAAMPSRAAVAQTAVDAGISVSEIIAPGEVSRADATRLRVELDHERAQVRGLAIERNHYRERAAAHHARADRNQSIAAEAMREGLAACEVLRAELDHERACSTVKCGACDGRGKVLCAREVEDGCDDCEASGLVPAVAEVDRLTARVAQLEAALNAAMVANVERLGEMEAQVERVAAERDAAVRESDRRAWVGPHP
jgi:hypothetical protein